jgi:hypothetical protein
VLEGILLPVVGLGGVTGNFQLVILIQDTLNVLSSEN